MGIRRAVARAAIALFAIEAVFSVGASGAAAEVSAEPTTIALVVDAGALGALGVAVDRLTYHARVETGATLDGSPETAALRAFVDPTTDGTGVAITLVDRATSRTDSRVVTLGDVPTPDRARVVALALAEMVRARRGVEPKAAVVAPVAIVTPPAARVDEGGSKEPARAPPSLAGELTGGATYFPKRGSALVDARFAGERTLGAPLWARIELGVGFGGSSDPAGDARLVLPSIGLGLRARTDPRATLSWGAGPSLEAGVAFASGSAGPSSKVRATSEESVTFRASLDGDLRARLGLLSLVAGVSAGVMLRGAELRADDRVVVGASGLALAARAGLVMVLP